VHLLVSEQYIDSIMHGATIKFLTEGLVIFTVYTHIKFQITSHNQKVLNIKTSCLICHNCAPCMSLKGIRQNSMNFYR